ncbi:MAG: DUF2254 domain-containing protein [Gemmatimonadetes bacterium]|nr:DUF2254 domain-containing protein [Gemmatimonadota bacterium]NIR80936.1 DUF2254 domain-containing protein [Gemmatimonadota bacterium]NIT89754.1 DUF2254 domain-containing protein [Gemmatimonadota bacterium]NIU33540.1 DUF2254 domain-containing protein [Gemmatimonadota bacterium]NIU37810.1 DUF2254 domain-containing protein [Gemmatimonadota bacterium]
MKARLLRLWDSLRASYWFIPSLMTVGAAVASQGALVLDRFLLARGGRTVAWLHGAGQPDGARAILSTVAGSMITVAGVTFSILLVALSLASSQFGPRLLRGFLRDRGNQVVLGTFIATFVYCLLVLRYVPMDPGTTTVPQISVGLALLFGLAGVAVLIFFVHHAASSIQASSVISTAGSELDSAIRQTFPAQDEEDGARTPALRDEALPEGFREEARIVEAKKSGYVQEIDTAGLVSLAAERNLVIELLHDRGSFVVEGRALARAAPPESVDEEVEEKIAGALVLASGRVSTRDVERGVSQLAEVAVRALSPGINDPFTAGEATRRLGLSLSLLAERQLPTSAYHDEEGALRLVVPTPTIPELLHAAFDRIRHYGTGDPHLPLELLEILTEVGVKARHPGLRRALIRHAEMVKRAATEALEEEADRERIEAAYETASAVLSGRREPESPEPGPEA